MSTVADLFNLVRNVLGEEIVRELSNKRGKTYENCRRKSHASQYVQSVRILGVQSYS